MTTVHSGLGAKLLTVTIGSMYSVLASVQKIHKASVNGFVKSTIQLRKQTIEESSKNLVSEKAKRQISKNGNFKKTKHANCSEKLIFLTPCYEKVNRPVIIKWGLEKIVKGLSMWVLVYWKNLGVPFCCNYHFEISPLAFSPTNFCDKEPH